MNGLRPEAVLGTHLKRPQGKKNKDQGAIKKIQLRVAEAKHRDVGKRRARIDPEPMRRAWHRTRSGNRIDRQKKYCSYRMAS